MTSTQQHAALAASQCEVAFDNLTRQLYATDASIYQVEPLAVAFPRNVKQACAVIQAAGQSGISIIPRGAGTGLTGGALGEGLVIDFARHNRQISDLDLEKKTVHVGAGVVLDQLNDFLRPHGFRFGPDVATSSRATLGGMIANNSSGSHTPVYGTTADHVAALHLVLAGGKAAFVGPHADGLPRQREVVEDLVNLNSLLIQERCPAGLLKRWPGYGLTRCLQDPGNLLHVLCGSEGTLAAIMGADLKIVPLPKEQGLGLLFFNSVAEAMQAVTELLDLKPAAIEHMDRLLLDQTRGQMEFYAARDLLELDDKPCESVLVVEFFEDVDDRLADLENRRLGTRRSLIRTPGPMRQVWALRKAGLSLLTSRKGNSKPVPGIEDAAVPPRRLAEYVAALAGVLERQGLQASFYGHAAAGLLHVRPVLDLHSRDDVKKFRQLAVEVSALVRQFKGSIAAEHGVGIARTQFLEEHLGPDLLEVMSQIKRAFDPHNLFNPGKIIPDGRYEFDSDLRLRPGRDGTLPFEPRLSFRARDESFLANLEQCNGCGGCLKHTPTMCPTFIATGDEYMSTRGRANAIRAVIEGRGSDSESPVLSAELDVALSNCLSCRACTVECPSNVNLALLKAEMQQAQTQRNGVTLRQRLIGHVDRFGRLGCAFPWVSNPLLNSSILRFFTARLLGIAAERPLQPFAKLRFDRWFAHRKHRGAPAKAFRGRLILWDDTFVRYHEPQIGIAAVRVLEALGFEVALPQGRLCCGRPAFSQGWLDEAARLGSHNISLLNQEMDNVPIVFLEPSCFSMFFEDYRELKLPDADRIARRCFLFEKLVDEMLVAEPTALRFKPRPGKVVIHAHCHAKAIESAAYFARLARRVPQTDVELLDTGCCGMAGAFGALASKYELSVKVAEPFIKKVRDHPYGTPIIASGTSCRQQIQHLAHLRPRHMAEFLDDVLI